jgi:hypothetical protein
MNETRANQAIGDLDYEQRRLKEKRMKSGDARTRVKDITNCHGVR